jgi:hypothetical protein
LQVRSSLYFIVRFKINNPDFIKALDHEWPGSNDTFPSAVANLLIDGALIYNGKGNYLIKEV